MNGVEWQVQRPNHYATKQHRIAVEISIASYLYSDSGVVAGKQVYNVSRTQDDRLQSKLHLDAGIEVAEVSVEIDPVQFETDVDNSPRTSVRGDVGSDSRSFCAVYYPRLAVLEFQVQLVGQYHFRHCTQQHASARVGLRQLARLETNPTSDALVSLDFAGSSFAT